MEVADAGDFTFIFVSTDGSTRRWQEQPAAMQAAHAIYEAACRHAVETHGGEIFQVVNDDIYAAFINASNALMAAVAIQKALAAALWPAPIDKLQAEVALHSGPGDISNGAHQATPTLNRLSRIHAVTHPGQILLSADTVRLVGAALDPATRLRDLGERRLRDVPQPMHLYQVLAPSLTQDFPPLKTLDRRDNNLPAARTSFVGREQDIATVCHMLRQADTRLVTLSGPGGTGKTRLSLEVAADLLDEYEHGVFFVPLAPVNDVTLVASTIAHTLGLQEEGGESIAETLKRHLSDKQMLLVLDNFEQVVAAAPLLSDWLAAAPALKLLVSSREVLHLAGEHEYAVAPLALPGVEQLPPLAELSEYPVIKLFVQRAQAVRFDFSLTNANAAAIVEICTRLDGLPLAIELAAARSRELDPVQMVAQLGNRFVVLVSVMRDLPPRQRSLRGAIEWSYDLLDEQEKLLFRRLAVFVAGWDEQAATQVCSGAGIAASEVAQLLGQLADKSLVQAQAEGEERRYLMLDTIREYALLVMVGEPPTNRYTMQQAILEYAQQELATHGEEAPLRERHAAHYRGLAEQADKNLVGTEQAVWLNRLETDNDNLRAALSWLQSKGETEAMLRMVNAMWGFWYVRGYLREGREWLESALAMSAGQVNDLRARALNSALAIADEQNDLRPAQEFGRQSLAIARQLDDKKRLSATLNSMGIVSIKLGEYATAQAQLSESMAIEQAAGSSHRLGTVTGNLGAVAEALGDYTLAHSMYQQSIALQRESGDTWGLANALLGDAAAMIEEGELTVARELLAEARQLYEELGGKQGIANTITNLGKIAELEDDLDTARARYEQGLTLMREVGRHGSVAGNLTLTANVVRKQGDLATAQALYRQALLVEQESAELENLPQLLEGIATLLLAMGQGLPAAQLLAAATALRETIGQFRPPIQQREVEQLATGLSSKLSAAELEAAQAIGRTMDAAAAISYVLTLLGEGQL